MTLSPLFLDRLDRIQLGLAWLSWGALLIGAVWRLRCSFRQGRAWGRTLDRFFPALMVLGLLIARAPQIVFPGAWNIDESALLGCALKATLDPVAWRSFDAGTTGPLPAYLLLWAVPFHLPFTYLVARLTGIACLGITLFSAWKILIVVSGRQRSWLGVFPLFTFYCFAWHSDLIRYSTEDLPVALLAIGTWLLLRLWKQSGRSGAYGADSAGTAFGLGIVLGAAPLAKLQATPAAAMLGGMALLVIAFMHSRRDRFSRGLRFAFSLLIGALLVPAMVLLPVIASGFWSEFVLRYLSINLLYGPEFLVEADQVHSYLGTFLYFLSPYSSHEFFPFAFGLCIWGGMVAGWRFWAIRQQKLERSNRSGMAWWIGMLLCTGYLIVSILIVIRPRMIFLHYLLFLPVPIVLWVGWIGRGFLGTDRKRGGFASISATGVALFLLLSVGTQFIYKITRKEARFSLSTALQAQEPNPVSQFVRKNTGPRDRIAIWGWAPEYYVDTQLVSATRDVIAPYTLMPWSRSDRLRADFLEDIKQTKPAIFLDAVGDGPGREYPAPWPHPLEKARHTWDRPLAEEIATHYRRVAAMEPQPGSPAIWIYLRNDLSEKQ